MAVPVASPALDQDTPKHIKIAASASSKALATIPQSTKF
jgi:hypothetical protein